LKSISIRYFSELKNPGWVLWSCEQNASSGERLPKQALLAKVQGKTLWDGRERAGMTTLRISDAIAWDFTQVIEGSGGGP